MDKDAIKERARMAATTRTKPNNRRTLAGAKDTADGGSGRAIAKRSNMLSITGEEANGLQISP